MKKYFFIIGIVYKNIKNYGLVNIFKIIAFELIFNILHKDFRTNFFDDTMTSSYDDTRNKSSYDTPYSPTPYFFLYHLNKFLKKKIIKDYIFIDFGCGAGRVLKFFYHDFNELVGIDINASFDKYFKHLEKIKFYSLNLRKNESFTKIKNIKKNRIFFFYEPFDFLLVKQYLELVNKEDYVILINYNFKINNFKTIFEKKLRNKNLIILKKLSSV